MEQNPQNGNQEEQTSRFIRWKWWRPVYYLYFAAVAAGVILLYSARGKMSGQLASTQPVSSAASKTTQPASPAPASGPVMQANTSGSTPTTHEASAKPKPSAQAAVPDRFADIMSPSSKTIAQGKNLFMNQCVACHGANGEGDGPAAAALKPKPRDFHSAKGWINGRMASGMFKTLTDGIPGSPMPPFSSLSVNDRLAIISYIRSFKGFPKETKTDIKKLAEMAEGSSQGND